MTSSKLFASASCALAAVVIAACSEAAQSPTAPSGLSASRGGSDRGAIHVDGLRCGIGLPGYAEPLMGTSEKQVITPSGNIQITCRGEAEAGVPLPSGAISYEVEEGGCFLYNADGTATPYIGSGRNVLTPSGNFVGKCFFKAE